MRLIAQCRGGLGQDKLRFLKHDYPNDRDMTCSAEPVKRQILAISFQIYYVISVVSSVVVLEVINRILETVGTRVRYLSSVLR